MSATGELPVIAGRLVMRGGQVVRLPLLSDIDLPADATRFVHDRRLPPVPPARQRP